LENFWGHWWRHSSPLNTGFSDFDQHCQVTTWFNSTFNENFHDTLFRRLWRHHNAQITNLYAIAWLLTNKDHVGSVGGHLPVIFLAEKITSFPGSFLRKIQIIIVKKQRYAQFRLRLIQSNHWRQNRFWKKSQPSTNHSCREYLVQVLKTFFS